MEITSRDERVRERIKVMKEELDKMAERHIHEPEFWESYTYVERELGLIKEE